MSSWRQHIWSKVSPQAATTSFTNPAPIVGSGPFTAAEFAKGKFLRKGATSARIQYSEFSA